jgi:exosome complex component CSL4
MNNGKFVLPGDLVGIAEEFLAGDGVYEEGGKLIASVTGVVEIDEKAKRISVRPLAGVPAKIKKGDFVVGRVTDVRESIALVELSRVKPNETREVSNGGMAIIHISNVRKEYVKDMNEEFSPLDIIKARVLDERTLQLSTVGRRLGVIKSICPHCRIPLRRNGDALECPKCKKKFKKKISEDYGTGVL